MIKKGQVFLFFIYFVLFIFAVVSGQFIGKNIFFTYQKIQFKKNLETSLEFQGKWFLENQTKNGDFVYKRNVVTGKKIHGYNIVRQAGSLYSLAQLYKKNKDPKIKGVLEKGFDFFKNFTKQQSFPLSGAAVVYEQEKKSNASALLLLALIEYMEASEKNKEKYWNFANQLAQYLVSTQTITGGFIQEFPGIESDYNNGESFYALIRMYLLSQNKSYLNAAEKAAVYFIHKYDDKGFNLSFYPWGMAGFSYLYKETRKIDYWLFMKKQTDQYFKNSGDNINSFLKGENKNFPRGNLAVFLEGLTHTAWVAKNIDYQYFLSLRSFIEKSLIYLMSLQVNGPISERNSNFSQVKGGLCYDYNCQTQRIDICHHYLSAIYLYLTFIIN